MTLIRKRQDYRGFSRMSADFKAEQISRELTRKTRIVAGINRVRRVVSAVNARTRAEGEAACGGALK
jgi:hypothetical protein